MTNLTGEKAQRSDAASADAATAALATALDPNDGLDAEGLRSYRLGLAREARRYKRYPPSAVDGGWQGTAEVRLILATGGIAQGVQLIRSSGHTVLDDAALDMLRQALPATPVPPILRGQSFVVNLPVVFELPD